MEKLQIKLMNVLLHSLESDRCPEEIKQTIREIAIFIKDEQHFKEEKDLEVLKELGTKLNRMQSNLNEKIDEITGTEKDKPIVTKGLKNKFYSLGNFCILNYYAYSPELSEYVVYIKSNLSLKDKSIKASFGILFDEYSVIQEIYNKNGIDGVVRLIALNNKVYRQNGSSVITLANRNVIDKDLLLNLTSSESVLAEDKYTVQVEKLLSGQVELDKNKEIIRL